MIGAIPNNWRDLALSENFKLGEFYQSTAFPDIARGMTPTKEQVDSLKCLCELCLQKVRDKFGATIITSGTRSDLLNKAVGGAGTSQHCRGKAVDFLCGNLRDMVLVYHFIRDNLKWPGEMFYYAKRGHVHVGLPEFGVVPNQLIVEK